MPCSWIYRRHPDIKLLRRPEDIPALAQRQAQLLRSAWSLLAPGGRLVYASCSALQAETVEVMRAFIAADACVRDVTQAFDAIGESAQTRPGHCIAAGTAGMDGFYYACVEKTKG